MFADQQTERERAQELALENEARIRMALDGANVGLFEWNLLTNESQWSTGFYRLHGLEPGGRASYELWRNQVHPDDVQRVEAEIRRAADQAETVDTDYRIIQPNGELRWTLLQASFQRDAQGRPLTLSGYCGDITRRKLADAALLESEKLAIAGRMSAALAHEINNPLEAANNLLFLARSVASEEDRTQFLDQAIEQLQRISEISHQTLNFVRPSRSCMVKVPELILSTLKLFAHKLRSNSLQVVTGFRGGGELWCSPGELQQILTNLLNNAAEASRQPRSATIRVRDSHDWRAQKTPGLRITIADSGPGMTPETLRRVREPFYTTKEGSGTGLGMWVVQELVSKRNGSITIRSSTHATCHGTVISVFFPAAYGRDVHTA